MNELYVPKTTIPAFRAAQWVYDDTDEVANFIKLLIDHNLRFKFDSQYEDYEVEVDVYRDGKLDVTVNNGYWLAVISGEVKVFTDHDFNHQFRKDKP